MARHLVVAGAGIGGLTAAIAMAQAGVRVTLLERRPRLAEFGAGVQLSPNATRVLDNLGLLDAIRAVAIEPQSARIRRGRDAADLARLPFGDTARARYGAPFLLVLRPALQRVLAERATDHPLVALRMNADVETVSVGADAEVRLGTAAGPVTADGFVDARGVGAADAQWSGRIAWRALVPSEALAVEHRRPDTNLWLGDRTHLVHYPLPGGAHVNVVAVTEARREGRDRADEFWSRPGDPAALRRAFDGWHPLALQLLSSDAEWRCWPLLDAPPRPTWSVGPTTILGDAAHPMLPFMAQGASQAIEDAGVLAETLRGEPTMAGAFAAYARRRQTRVARVQAASRSQGHIYHLRRPAADARDLALRLLGGSRALARMDWLYGVG